MKISGFTRQGIEYLQSYNLQALVSLFLTARKSREEN
jgi:hypothetical protein